MLHLVGVFGNAKITDSIKLTRAPRVALQIVDLNSFQGVAIVSTCAHNFVHPPVAAPHRSAHQSCKIFILSFCIWNISPSESITSWCAQHVSCLLARNHHNWPFRKILFFLAASRHICVFRPGQWLRPGRAHHARRRQPRRRSHLGDYDCLVGNTKAYFWQIFIKLTIILLLFLQSYSNFF